MSQTDCIGPMKVAMKLRRDMIAVACDSFMKMFQSGDDELIEQVSTSFNDGELIEHVSTSFNEDELIEQVSTSFNEGDLSVTMVV